MVELSPESKGALLGMHGKICYVEIPAVDVGRSSGF